MLAPQAETLKGDGGQQTYDTRNTHVLQLTIFALTGEGAEPSLISLVDQGSREALETENADGTFLINQQAYDHRREIYLLDIK